MANYPILVLSMLALVCALAFASEPSPLQDFCVADPTSPGCSPTLTFLVLICIIKFYSSSIVTFPSNLYQNLTACLIIMAALVNGRACLDSKLAQAHHFFLIGLNETGNTSNALGSVVTPVTGSNSWTEHIWQSSGSPRLCTLGTHPSSFTPSGDGILTVLTGSLYVGFVTSNPENRLISKVLKKGDVFVFPVGLVHFQQKWVMERPSPSLL